MTTKTLEFNNIERMIFWILATALGVSIAFYLYSVISMTVSVVGRDKVLSEARIVSSVAGELEQEYMSLQNGMTLAHAEKLGFKEVSAKFATEASPKLVVLR